MRDLSHLDVPARRLHPAHSRSLQPFQGRGPWIRSGSFGLFRPMVMLAPLIALVTGCGDAGLSVEPVNGVVVMDGSPVAGATVIFTPTSGGGPATAITGADGGFSLSSFVVGKLRRGVVAGTYTVTVQKVEYPAGDGLLPNDPKYDLRARHDAKQTPIFLVPKAYGVAASSGLTATIAKGTNDVRLELDSKFAGK